MILYSKTIKKAVGLSLIALVSSVSLHAESRTFAIPNYKVNPGDVLQVPLTLNNAAGLAAIEVQINFDSKVIDLQSVTAGSLGQSFEMSQGEGDGFVKITLFRGNGLSGGSGQLVLLNFMANSGAVADLFSELAIANVVLSDATGVIDLRQKDTITITNGHVTVSTQPNIDNTGSGLPDNWERQHGLNAFENNQLVDSDKDGLPNLLEYAFGANPNAPDAASRGTQFSKYEADGVSYLKLGFRRRLGDTALIFRVQESDNLIQWTDLNVPQRMIGLPQNLGDGTEYVEIQGTLPLNGPDAEPKGFMRVGVERP